VVNRLPVARPNVSGKNVEVAGICLDGVRGSVTFPQMAEEVVGGALDDSSVRILSRSQ
jgi:hypothetical protein